MTVTEACAQRAAQSLAAVLPPPAAAPSRSGSPVDLGRTHDADVQATVDGTDRSAATSPVVPVDAAVQATVDRTHRSAATSPVAFALAPDGAAMQTDDAAGATPDDVAVGTDAAPVAPPTNGAPAAATHNVAFTIGGEPAAKASHIRLMPKQTGPELQMMQRMRKLSDAYSRRRHALLATIRKAPGAGDRGDGAEECLFALLNAQVENDRLKEEVVALRATVHGMQAGASVPPGDDAGAAAAADNARLKTELDDARSTVQRLQAALANAAVPPGDDATAALATAAADRDRLTAELDDARSTARGLQAALADAHLHADDVGRDRDAQWAAFVDLLADDERALRGVNANLARRLADVEAENAGLAAAVAASIPARDDRWSGVPLVAG